MKKEDLKKQSGTIPSPYDERDIPFSVLPAVKKEEIPEQFSLRSEQTSVKHQGEVGACTAFAACAINEMLQKVKDLNERHLYCRRSNKPGPGMHPRDACKLLQKKGVCLEVCWPYISDAIKLCKGSPCKNVNEQAQLYRINSYNRVFNSLKTTLYSLKTPILIVVPIYENWGEIGSDGIVPMPNNSEFIGYHALCLTGYNLKYFECKNSWGSFGDKGYLHIPTKYPVTEGWAMKKGEIEQNKIEVQNWQIGKKNLFGANVSFTIHSTIKCRASLLVNGKKSGFQKRINEGTNHIHFNIPFELNNETAIKLEFTTGSFFNGNIIATWEGILKTETTIIGK